MADFDSGGRITMADLCSILNQCVLEEKHGRDWLEIVALVKAPNADVTLEELETDERLREVVSRVKAE